MIKNYLIQNIKSNLKAFLCITIIFVAVYPLYIIPIDFLESNELHNYLLVIVLGLLCYIIPISNNAYLMKKNTIDYYYSLPITRRTILNINLLVGYLKIIIPFTISYIIGVIISISKVDTLNSSLFINFYFCLVIYSLALYLFNSFIASRANTVVDSVIFVILYSFVFILIYEMICNVSRDFDYEIYRYLKGLRSESNMLISFYGLFAYQAEYQELIFNQPSINEHNPWFIISLAVISYILLFFFTKKDKAERAEQISTSIFGYEVLIPIYYLGLYFALSIVLEITLFIVLSVMLLTGFIIYYRKFKLPKKAYIKLFIYMAIVIVFAIILEAI